MRFSPEGIPNCGADVATWSTGVVDPESQIFDRKGSADFAALISCEGCPLDNKEFPSEEVPVVTDLKLQEFLEANCPKSSSQRPRFDMSVTELPPKQ